MPDISLEETEHISLCEVLDRVLNKGAVVSGEVTISIANVDLIYLGIQLIVASIETVYNHHPLKAGSGFGSSSDLKTGY